MPVEWGGVAAWKDQCRAGEMKNTGCWWKTQLRGRLKMQEKGVG